MFLRAWGQLKRWVELLALCEMCFEGMGAVEKGVEVLALGESFQHPKTFFSISTISALVEDLKYRLQRLRGLGLPVSFLSPFDFQLCFPSVFLRQCLSLGAKGLQVQDAIDAPCALPSAPMPTDQPEVLTVALQVLQRKLNPTSEEGIYDALIVSVDLQEMAPIAGVTLLQGDITNVETAERIIGHLKGQKSVCMCAAQGIEGQSGAQKAPVPCPSLQ